MEKFSFIIGICFTGGLILFVKQYFDTDKKHGEFMKVYIEEYKYVWKEFCEVLVRLSDKTITNLSENTSAQRYGSLISNSILDLIEHNNQERQINNLFWFGIVSFVAVFIAWLISTFELVVINDKLKIALSVVIPMMLTILYILWAYCFHKDCQKIEKKINKYKMRDY